MSLLIIAFMVIIAFMAAAILVFVFFAVKKTKSSGNPASGTEPSPVISEPEDKSSLKSINDFINEKDPGFSLAVFTEKISNLYIRLCNSIEDKNTLIVKPYFSDDILSSYDREIKKDRENNLKHVFDKLTVLSSSVSGWKTEGSRDIIIAEIRSRITDYKIDSDGNPVSGGMNTEKFLTSEWTLERDSSEKTVSKHTLTAQNCPNCGAVININSSSVCDYCGCVLNTDGFNWIVTKIKTISVNEVNI